ncbi:MAG: translation initiation factor IF-2 [Bryobacterales bacterium]|nr:translation initiation factor IF-2 [Bryobacterales bacterium]
MSKIRINELARELEVKPGRIIDVLPELGVSDKKTHSSSLDDDLANAIRKHFGFPPVTTYHDAFASYQPSTGAEQTAEVQSATATVEAPPALERPRPIMPPLAGHRPLMPPLARTEPEKSAPPVAEPPAPLAAPAEPEPVAEATPESEPATPAMPPSPGPVAAPAPAMPAAPGAPAAPAAPLAAAPAAPAAPAEEPKPRVAPLRPPLAARPTPGVAAPLPRPAAPSMPASPAPPAAVHAPGPRPPRPVPPPPPQAAAPGAPAPPAPRPQGPRPGQILSGPRQPLPGGPAQQEVRPPAPGMPPPPPPRPQVPKTPPPAVVAPGGPQQPSRPTVVGQPPPRPVVPPRPEMVARLQQQTRAATPGQPAAPRPGAPQARQAPVPGQPIYRGPIRPGQPIVRGPGMPGVPVPGGGPGGLGRPQRGRGMHPTTPLPPEPTPAPTDTRRHPTKPGARAAAREREIEEGKLQPMGRQREEPVVASNREITIGEGITVKELAEKLGLKSSLVIKKLVDRKIFATINQTLDLKLAEDIAKSFGATSSRMSFEEESSWEVEMAEESGDLLSRAPVVTVMGHVDHGKTSLLDSIRQAEVAAHEAGGITQHIGAYQIRHNDRNIVFIDTPGHEAFTRMRARGAKVTDIVVLVVAADDGVMPQTLEAIDHARAAKVPIVVAINKIDKPDAQPDRIKQQLSDRGLLAEDWGGDTVMVPVSAKAKQNLDLLLEMILLVADMQNLKANPTRPAICTVLEAKLDRGRGPVATVLVRNGTLRVGDFFICGTVFSRVRALVSDRGDQIKDAEPSTPVEVLGLDSLPEVGETLQVITDTAKAKQIVMFREQKQRETQLAKSNRLTLETLHQQLREGETKELNLIIKADVGGSAEVLSEMLQKLSTDKVRIKVLHTGVGAITETDVLLASASDAIVIGFNVRPERNASAIAEQENVDIRLHTIIYELTQEMKQAMIGMLEPVFKEVYKGRAEVRDVFRITKVGTVAGCYVLDGVINRGSEVRVLRDNIVVHTGKIDGLKRFKDDVSEVKSGFECGISLANYNDIKSGDVFEVFTTQKVASEALV